LKDPGIFIVASHAGNSCFVYRVFISIAFHYFFISRQILEWTLL